MNTSNFSNSGNLSNHSDSEDVLDRSVNSKFSDWTQVFDPNVEITPYLETEDQNLDSLQNSFCQKNLDGHLNGHLDGESEDESGKVSLFETLE